MAPKISFLPAEVLLCSSGLISPLFLYPPRKRGEVTELAARIRSRCSSEQAFRPPTVLIGPAAGQGLDQDTSQS